MAAKKTASNPPEKVLRCAVARDDERYLYYVDKRCNVVRMERGVPRAPTEILVKSGLRRERGFMYYLDDDGDLVREPDTSRE